MSVQASTLPQSICSSNATQRGPSLLDEHN
jgi:hypothetical protein